MSDIRTEADSEKSLEQSQLIRMCDSLLGDLESARADCVRRDADQRSLRAELADAQAEIHFLKQQLFSARMREADRSVCPALGSSFLQSTSALNSELE